MYSVKEMSYYDLVSLMVKEPSEVLKSFPTPQMLYKASPEELNRIGGIGKVKSVLLAAALELGRRSTILPKETPVKITCPADVYNLCSEMATLDREQFRVLSLNNRNIVLGQDELFVGGINSCIVDLRILFSTVIRKYTASSIILLHNHPSLDSNIVPSQQDIEISKQVANAGKILNISLLDSIIIGNGYCSLKERGLI